LTADRAAAAARHELARLARPAGAFDASRYFRSGTPLAFYNVGTQTVRTMARTLAREQRGVWTVNDARRLADRLIADSHFEVKAFGIEVLACFRKEFAPALLPVCKKWLAANHSANWATTDAICGVLVGPLVLRYPALVPTVSSWACHRNMWVRRAAVVGLIPTVRRGLALREGYATARRLHADREDLIQKAVGWMLREAGKADSPRLERYLRQEGPRIPRTTLRYAIERFPPAKRRTLLAATRPQRG
jgi:3-methyladenine DNA glycosylase AlkD